MSSQHTLSIMKTNRLAKLIVVAAIALFAGDSAKADYQIIFNTYNNPASPVSSTNPVFDSDGTTKLDGSASWVGRLYDGSTALGTTFASFLSGAGAGFVQANNVNVVDATVVTTVSKTFQFKVWNTGNGATFDIAQAAGGKVGSASMTLTVAGYNPLTDTTPTAIPTANTFASFNVAAVPEPATLALGLFGAAGLLFRRRK